MSFIDETLFRDPGKYYCLHNRMQAKFMDEIHGVENLRNEYILLIYPE